MAVVPVATYRLQLTPEHGFDHAVGLLDHVRQLGVSHLYLSPIAQAVPDSTHGYDVVDHGTVRAEFGGAAAFEQLLDAVADRGMAVVVDHVPNHVATTRPELNPQWWALLRDGQGSDADAWFDVDWDAADGRVILPVLGAPAADVVAAGELSVDEGDLVVHGTRRLPLRPGTEELPLDELLAVQHYRLQHWRDPDRNYRRFFTIDDLAAIRVEHADVAAAVDALVTRYAVHPAFGGVRVDHVDGLAEPAGYLAGLRAAIGPDALLYVEKILATGERLPTAWPVDGTTGYEFIRDVEHALLAERARPVLDRRWSENRPDDRDFHTIESDARREVVDGALAPDFERLVRLAASALPTVAGPALRAELYRLTTELPRYRTYLPDDADAAGLIAAISGGPVAGALLDPATPRQVELRTRWQQLTGPVMAKGAEDRAFYRYARLASLCEVGGDPGRFGLSVDDLHAANADRLARCPRTLLAASTHDTKRSEDVRAHSIAMTWRIVDRRYPLASGAHAAGERWGEASRSWVEALAGATGVDRVAVSLGAQTIVTTPGLDATRLASYLVKACREAATRTTWEDPDPGYEERLGHLAALLVAEDPSASLGLEAIAPGISLAATALRMTAPGVPDVYQGAEGFTFRLVDPDNRVAPDWDDLARAATDERSVAELWGDHDDAVKPVLIRELLALRRRRPASFGAGGSYRPIDVDPGVIAFGRGDDVVVVVRRGLAEVGGGVELAPGSWYDVLDPVAPTLSGSVDVTALVGSGADLTLPIAVFERD